MLMKEIPDTFRSVFTYMYLNQDLFNKKIKPEKYPIDKMEKKLLKLNYNLFQLYKYTSYKSYIKMCINMSLLYDQDIIWSCLRVSENLNSNLYKKII